MYVFLLDAISGAEFDVSANATKSYITVAASENPYGIIDFIAPYVRNVTEDVGTLTLTLTRTGGVIGQIAVHYAITSDSAVRGEDFTPDSGGKYEIMVKKAESYRMFHEKMYLI